MGQAAKTGERATERIMLRVTPGQKLRFTRAAWPQGLTRWILEQLDQAAPQIEFTEADVELARELQAMKFRSCQDRERERRRLLRERQSIG